MVKLVKNNFISYLIYSLYENFFNYGKNIFWKG